MNNHAAQYEIVSIDSVKVKVNYKLEKTKVSHSEKWDTFVIYSCTNQQNCVGEIPYLSEKFR